jgi:hypothetical protein
MKFTLLLLYGNECEFQSFDSKSVLLKFTPKKTPMKNLRITLATVVILFSLGLSPVSAIGNKKIPVESTMTPAELQVLMDRLEEIKKINKSSLTKAEKKDLRNELRDTKEEIKRNGGVYLSVGALILVIVLLILLL